MVMPVAAVVILIRSVTAYITLRETTVRGACPSTMTNHGDMEPQTMPSRANLVTVTTTPLAVTTTPAWTRSLIAMRWEGEECVTTVRTTLVWN